MRSRRRPAGATINAGSGLVTIPTGTALEAATVTVRATNAAGSRACRASR